MRRGKYIVLNAASLLSLGLAVGVVGVWVRSYRTSDRLNYVSGPTRVALTTGPGEMIISLQSGDVAVFGDGPFYSSSPQLRIGVIAARWTWLVLGVGYQDRTFLLQLDEDGAPPNSVRTRSVMLPSWAVAGVLGAAGVLGIRAWRRRRRRAGVGLCAACGYDLRATPERCPECGALATAA